MLTGMRSSTNRSIVWFCSALLLVAAKPGWTQTNRLEQLGQVSTDNPRAAALIAELQGDPDLQLLDVLSAMKDQSAVAKNWYLSLAQTLADRDPERSMRELDQYLPKLSEDPTGRYWAFRFVSRDDPDKREQLLESMLADPALELRYEAVELWLGRLAKDDLSQDQRVSRYRELLAAARLPAQVQKIANLLEEQDVSVDLLEHFGFVSSWQTVGPFDNLGQQGFDVAYPPENALGSAPDLAATYQGKTGQVAWQPVATAAEDGAVDLNEVYQNEKGAAVYAFATFDAADDSACEVRIGSPNACKVWVNGKLAISREVYHAGNQVDQYTAPVELKQGANRVLVKVCQNEQKESWAQDWTFQLRFTDSSGLAIQPAR